MERLSIRVYVHIDHLMRSSQFSSRFIKENYKNEDYKICSIHSFRKARRFLLD